MSKGKINRFNPYTDLCWCPFVRLTTDTNNYILTNRNEPTTQTHCIGSDCAALVIDTEEAEMYLGYCGLAHKE